MKTVYYSISACCLLLISTGAFAQSGGTASQPSSTGIVTFPITTTNTTDPNYEANLAKYKDYTTDVPATEPVKKDEAYYLKEIADLKKDISDKEKTENKNAEGLMKIDHLKTELRLLEENYKELIVK